MPSDLDPEPIFKALKKATSFEVFLISFLALPFVFNAWLSIADKLALSRHQKFVLIPVVSLVYLLGMVLMFLGNSYARRQEVARDQIIAYLKTKNYTMVSFEGIRKNINQTYGDDFLSMLPVQFPNEVRRAVLKGGMRGLARIEVTDIADEG